MKESKLPIKRPKVKSKDGKEKHLISYQAGKDSSASSHK